jgi:hypothetical protein
MPAKAKHKGASAAAKTKKAVKVEGKRARLHAREDQGGVPESLAGEVKRLAREMEVLQAEWHKRSVGAGDDGVSRRDQGKALADRLARLDEKVDALWARVSDLEEALEGEGGRTRDADFDEAPDRDFFEH